MRAAAIFGPGASNKDLKPFQQNPKVTWLLDSPTDSSEADAILIFGGDGTIHRRLAQLVTMQLPVLIVPCGSGNDFARALNLRGVRDSLGAWGKFCSGGKNVWTIDLGVITPSIAGQDAGEATAPHGTGHYFCCVGGVGLDAEISRRMAEWKAPSPRYKTGVFAKYAALVNSASEGAITTPIQLSHSRR